MCPFPSLHDAGANVLPDEPVSLRASLEYTRSLALFFDAKRPPTDTVVCYLVHDIQLRVKLAPQAGGTRCTAL